MHDLMTDATYLMHDLTANATYFQLLHLAVSGAATGCGRCLGVGLDNQGVRRYTMYYIRYTMYYSRYTMYYSRYAMYYSRRTMLSSGLDNQVERGMTSPNHPWAIPLCHPSVPSLCAILPHSTT